jgi:hypothetical protein
MKKSRNKKNNFHYKNKEKKMIGGAMVVRNVSIKNGKGYKSITRYHRGKRVGTHKKPLHTNEIDMIKKGKFISGLFSDLKKR